MEEEAEPAKQNQFQRSKNGWIAIGLALLFFFASKPMIQMFGAFQGFMAMLGIMRDERKLPSIIAMIIGIIGLVWISVFKN